MTTSPAAERLPETRPEGDWLERACIIVPAYDAERSIGRVVSDLKEAIPELRSAIFVVDDGSHDATAHVAAEAGAIVLASAGRGASFDETAATLNLGKGGALRAGFEAARRRGMTVALTVDADGQHPASEARRVLFASADPAALVLGTRNLVRDGAPRANRFSNGVSNWFISRFAGQELGDTQCGLRRYPIEETLALGAHGEGYDFEAEVLLRSVWNGIEVVEEPVRVLYPADRTTHFESRRDVAKIIRTIVVALAERRRPRAA